MIGLELSELSSNSSEETNVLSNDNTKNIENYSNKQNVINLKTEKTIGPFSSFCFLVNNITGAGMVLLSPVFQQSGMLTSSIVLLFMLIASALCSTFLAEAMSRVPNNESFNLKMELTNLAKYYFGHKGFVITLVLFALSLQSALVAAIVESAQTMDYTFLAIFEKTCGLEIYPNFGFSCVESAGEGASPFGSSVVISIGFLSIMIFAIPFGIVDLEDNMIVQIISFIFLILIVVEWIAVFCYQGLELNKVSFVQSNQSNLLGTIMFNYTFVIFIPSWINQKSSNVNINKSVWSASAFSTFLYLIVGLLGALAFSFTGTDSNILSLINVSSLGYPKGFKILSMITVYSFPLITSLTTIPIYSIIIRCNLISNKCPKVIATVVSIAIPWILSIPFYGGNGLSEIVNWSSILFAGFLNFLVPLIMYVICRTDTFESKRSKSVVKAIGPHNTVLITAEISGLKLPKIREPTFLAVPPIIRFKPQKLAFALAVVVVILLIMAIVLNLISVI